MAKLPSVFQSEYIPLKLVTESGMQYVPVNRYLSGNPWTKQFHKQALADFSHFVHRTSQYKNKNFERQHELYGNGFAGSFNGSPSFVPVTWGEMQFCFYGKGRPQQFANTLRVLDYYLTYADISHSYLQWSRRLRLDEYAYYYLGIDCNGFAGAYYQTTYPATGIDGNDHINFLHEKSTLKERASVFEMRTGDMLVRRGSDGGGTRHVVLIDSIVAINSTEATVSIAHSSGSRDGLAHEVLKLREDTSPASDSYGKLRWDLVGYHKFNRVLAPK